MTAAGPDPIETVTTYLRLSEDRRLDDAKRYLANDIEIVFPGDRRFASLDEQVAASRGRYRSIRKTFDRFDVLAERGSEIVYVFGTLEGESFDGRRFELVRFIDRFELVDGMIVSHFVWNDLAEALGGIPTDRHGEGQ